MNNSQPQQLQPRHWLPLALPLLGLGFLVGLVCLPLNAIDQWVDGLLAGLFDQPAGAWILLPLPVMPLLLLLQRGPLRQGLGSGIPQTVLCLEEPERRATLLGLRPLGARLLLWTVASLSLLPLGREGPVVFVGAALVWALRPWLGGVLQRLQLPVLLAVAGGAGLAAGFNTPLVGAVFAAEDLLQRWSTPLLWAALPVVLPAALVAGLGGEALFGYGLVPVQATEYQQLLVALPLGLMGGLLGALFSGLVLYASRRLAPLSRSQPLVTGLCLGAALVLLALVSGGRAYGDGSQVLVDLISRGGSLPPAEGLRVLLARLLGPVLALGAGIPGGLIDPALSIGGVAGGLLLQLFSGQDPLLGIALGMAAGLAGSTQLPIFSTLFALRLCGDQQVLPGVLLASAVAAMVSRSLQPSPVYHGLTELFRQGLATPEAPEAEPQRAPRR